MQSKNCKSCCDTPARTFITLVKGHADYYSCSKCIQEGECENHVILSEINSTLRTDKSFRNKQHPQHHTGTSILEELNIDMVSQVALDYLHLVCLGVMKRLINIWIKGPTNLRFTNNQQSTINKNISSIKSFIHF